MDKLFTKARIIIILVLVLLFSVLTIINTIGGNENEYTGNSSDTSSSTNSSTNINASTTSTTSTTSNTTSTTTSTTTKKRTTKTTRKTEAQVAGTYTLTHYGWDCAGCKSGTTATGYDVRHTIYYKDPTYGSLRIVAMRNVPTYSVIKIKNYNGQDIMAIVLDRCKSGSIVDLLVQNEATASQLGIKRNIEIEIIRSGK